VQNFAFKLQAVAEKTAKNVRGLLYFAAPCSFEVVRIKFSAIFFDFRNFWPQFRENCGTT